MKAFTRIQGNAKRVSLRVTQRELLRMQEQLTQLLLEQADETTHQYQQRRIDNHMVFFSKSNPDSCSAVRA